MPALPPSQLPELESISVSVVGNDPGPGDLPRRVRWHKSTAWKRPPPRPCHGPGTGSAGRASGPAPARSLPTSSRHGPARRPRTCSRPVPVRDLRTRFPHVPARSPRTRFRHAPTRSRSGRAPRRRMTFRRAGPYSLRARTAPRADAGAGSGAGVGAGRRAAAPGPAGQSAAEAAEAAARSRSPCGDPLARGGQGAAVLAPVRLAARTPGHRSERGVAIVSHEQEWVDDEAGPRRPPVRGGSRTHQVHLHRAGPAGDGVR